MKNTDPTTPRDQFTQLGDALIINAPAKINLTLLIAGKRADGFHELETIMAKITYYDEIRIEPGAKPGLELVCTGPHWAPEGPDNLVLRAADALLKATNTTADLKITLTKNIPAGSGLGSASSDAASTLLALDRFLSLNAPADLLASIAAQLGSDIPFFLGPPLALCTGRGEKIAPLKSDSNFTAQLVLPDVSVSTKKVYENYTHDQQRYRDLHKQINTDIEQNNIDFAPNICANMLEHSCFDLVPALGELKAKLLARGMSNVCLSGSGSAMFCLQENTDEATAQGPTDLTGEHLHCILITVRNNRW